MVLQPFSGFKHPLAPEEAAFTLYKYREETLKALYERTASQLAGLAAADRVRYLDARHLYDGDSAYIFIDDVHLTRLGYERLADAIATIYASDHSHAACAS
jgi:lysophospholipase L1-like esterase